MDLINYRDLLLLALVFVPLERLLALHPRQKVFRSGWVTDLVYALFNGILIKFGLVLVILAILAASDNLVPTGLRTAVAAQPVWLQTLEVLVLGDLGFYAVHRLFHTVPWLWRFHAVHHSIEDMDWLAAHRVHPVDQVMTKGASLIPCFALGFSEAAIAIWFAIYHWHSFLLHSNLRITIGPLRWVVASPEFHHWHHGNEPEAFDKNFAGQLPVLDLIFRTAHMPPGRRPKAFGTDDPVPKDYPRQLIYPFRASSPAVGTDGVAAATNPLADRR